MLCNIPHCGFAGLFPDGWTWLTHGMAGVAGMAGVDPGVACEGAVPVHLSPSRDAELIPGFRDDLHKVRRARERRVSPRSWRLT